MAAAINENTIALVGSACELSVWHDRSDRQAFGNWPRERGVGLHVDACLGGFLPAVGRTARPSGAAV